MTLTIEDKERRAAMRRRKKALQAEADADRQEQKRQEWHERGMYLTREELEAGAHCRGCGLPVLDGIGSWRPLLKLTDAERAEHQTAESEYRQRHPDCHSHRWSMAGSRAEHCGLCCPPPPLSAAQLKNIQSILQSSQPPNPANLDTWRLTLTCDHVTERHQHKSNRGWTGLTSPCPECKAIRGIVSVEKLPPAPVQHSKNNEQFTAELESARRSLERQESKTLAAQRRVAKLEAEQSPLTA